MGLDVHDSQTSTLEANQVITVEPGVYFNEYLLDQAKAGTRSRFVVWNRVDQFRGTGGVRIEDVFIPDDGAAGSPEEDILVGDEHMYDVELWRCGILTIGERSGEHLGRSGTFITKEWEVAVLPGCLIYVKPTPCWSCSHALRPCTCDNTFELLDKPFGPINPRKTAFVFWFYSS